MRHVVRVNLGESAQMSEPLMQVAQYYLMFCHKYAYLLVLSLVDMFILLSL